MDWKDKKVLVTGSSGFIGRNLCKKLKTLESKVIKYDILNNDRNILNKYLLETIIQTYNPDVVYHLAAVTQVQLGRHDPYNTFLTNELGTLNVIESCRKYNIKKIVVASSDKAYGSKGEEYNEGMSLDAINPYDSSKAITDIISNSYRKSFDMNISTSRFCNIIGFDSNFRRLIPSVIKNFIDNVPIILRSDGSMKREYLYISDCIEGYLKLADSEATDYNFGGHYKSVDEVVSEIHKHFNNKNKIIYQNNAIGEIQDQKLNYDKTKDTLNWEPKINFEESIKLCVEEYKKYYGVDQNESSC